MSALTFDEVQERASEWVARNFPDKMPLDAALVAAEEASEAAAAMTRMLVKQRQGIRGNEDFEARVLTEYADTLIAFADWCSTRGWTLQDVIANRLDEVTARDWRSAAVLRPPTPEQHLAAIRSLVDEQANDEGLWGFSHGIVENYLQIELRRLHALVEAGPR